MTLLPVASKVMGRVIIKRIQNGLDHVLRKERAGFRKNKSTINQIFILRNIIEQVKMSGTLSISKKLSTLYTAKDCGES